MITLGVDYGTRRIGLALSDPEAKVVLPIHGLQVQSDEDGIRKIKEVCGSYSVQKIVVGLPIHMHGDHGPEVRRVREFCKGLRKISGLPVDTVDERLSTAAAHRSLRDTGMSMSKRMQRVDSVAAQKFLQKYLDIKRASESPGNDE